MAWQRTVVTLAVFFSTGLFAAQAPDAARGPAPNENSPNAAEIARGLALRWTRVTYRKGLQNPAVSPEDRSSLEPESLSISCEIRMADPRLLLGTASEPTIEKITDSQGNDVDVNRAPPPLKRRYDQGVFFTRWLKDINLSHPERTRIPSEHYPPQMELDAELPRRVSGDIGLLKGRYEALMAESIEYIDLPFRPDDNWVRLTDDVEIRVVQARNMPGVYHYEIEQRPEIVLSANRVDVGEPLPSRLVVGRQMIMRSDSMIGAGGSGPGRIGGRGSGIGRAEGIRYIIAVNPVPVMIPFELRDIPVSAPDKAIPPHKLNPDRLKARLGGKYIPPQARTAMRYEADKVRNQANPAPMAKDGRFFDVDWHSIGYTLNLYNPAVTKNNNSLNLSISCKARILEPELILGTCAEPIIERIMDGRGRDVNIALADPRPGYMRYKSPAYRSSSELTPPSAVAQLEGKARSALRLPLHDRHRSTRKMELEPVRITIRLDPRLIGQNQKEIGRIEGYFHALTAESYKHVKVPFKPSRRWVRLTSDLSIQVARAWHDGVKYRFEINERSKAQIDPGRLHVYCPLPDGILVERQLTGSNVPPRQEDMPRAARYLPVSAGGRGLFRRTADGVDCELDTIDYRIAVGPTHYRIPIRLENIPLPDFSPRAPGEGTEAQGD